MPLKPIRNCSPTAKRTTFVTGGGGWVAEPEGGGGVQIIPRYAYHTVPFHKKKAPV